MSKKETKEKNIQAKEENKSSVGESSKKELKDASKKELMKLVRDQHKHIKAIEADNEYLNGVFKANNILVAAMLLKLGMDKVKIEHAFMNTAKQDYVLHWERDPDTLDMSFQLQDRVSYEEENTKS